MLFIFDMGGVVSGNVSTIPSMANRLGIGADDFFRLCGVPDGTPKEKLYDYGLLAAIQSGSINSTTFWDLFRQNAKALFPSNHAAASRIAIATRAENLWETCFKPEPMGKTIEIIATLKRNGHRVVCGTNTLDAHYAVHKKSGDYGIFDEVYASHFMGLIKPHREFWDRIIELEKADPAKTFFIDDNEQNVRGSILAGLKGILFTTAEGLAGELSPYLASPATVGQEAQYQ